MWTRAIWAIFALPLAATAVTYWRLPAGSTYHFDDSGPVGAASRAVSYLNFPVAVAALALLWALCRGPAALVAAGLCLVAFVPGVVTTDDLTASWANLPAVIGVGAALWLTLAAPPGRPAPLGRARRLLLAALVVWSLPWLFAMVGVYADSVAGGLIRASQPTPGQPQLASVHHGLHEGLFGAQLAAAALLVSLVRMRRGLSLYVSLMLCYGLAVTVQDGWNEQVVKRGWSATQTPDVLEPAASLAWAGLLVAAVIVHAAWFSREHRH